MIVMYRRLFSKVWEPAILLGPGYHEDDLFILRWTGNDNTGVTVDDYEEVNVPKSRVRIPSKPISYIEPKRPVQTSL